MTGSNKSLREYLSRTGNRGCYALQIGVDALLVDERHTDALIAKSQRGESASSTVKEDRSQILNYQIEIIEVKKVGLVTEFVLTLLLCN